MKNYINGQWIPSLGTDTVDVINPANEALLGKCPLGTSEDVNAAVAAAKEAFKEWRKTPAMDRVQHLFKLKTLLEENFDELVQLCTKEHGKTIAESK